MSVASKLVWEAARIEVPDENCPQCDEPLKYENGHMICPNGHGVFAEAPTPGEFNINNLDFSNATGQTKQVEQPLYKWSYDGKSLTIWPVDEKYGRPHHIEVTGLDFYKLAQGRVYQDGSGALEILVWEDRGTPEMQDEAIEAVEAYLQKKLGKGAEYYAFQSEGGIYQNLNPDDPDDMDKMMTAYFGYPVKTQKQQDPTQSEGI